MNTDSKKICIAMAILLVVGIFLAVFLQFDKWFGQFFEDDDYAASRAREQMNTVYVGDTAYLRRERLKVYLVIGIDGEGDSGADSYYNDRLCDFLLVAAVDQTKGTCSFLQINRDTMMRVPKLDVRGQKYYGAKGSLEQIALAHTYGDGGTQSCRNTADAVSDLLFGLKIDRYICLQMSDVVALNDYFGGVTVTMQEDLTAVDPAFENGATVTLAGSQALSFVRARGALSDGSNLHRMENQRIYMKALLAKLSAEKDTYTNEFLAGAYNAVKDSAVTNCTVDEMTDLITVFSNMGGAEIHTPAGEAVRGTQFMEFYVDEKNLQELAVQLYYDEFPSK